MSETILLTMISSCEFNRLLIKKRVIANLQINHACSLNWFVPEEVGGGGNQDSK